MQNLTNENFREYAKKIYESTLAYIKFLNENPQYITDDIKTDFNTLWHEFCQQKGVSDCSHWGVKWTVFKWHNKTEKEPYEVIERNFSEAEVATAIGNMILNNGANEMLKLISGIGGKTYSNANAKIYVGNNNTVESPEQTGIIAMGGSRAFAGMDIGYPKVSGRTITYRATFSEKQANFDWYELSITNGDLESGGIALNRKKTDMGRKQGGIWAIQAEMTILDA